MAPPLVDLHEGSPVAPPQPRCAAVRSSEAPGGDFQAAQALQAWSEGRHDLARDLLRPVVHAALAPPGNADPSTKNSSCAPTNIAALLLWRALCLERPSLFSPAERSSRYCDALLAAARRATFDDFCNAQALVEYARDVGGSLGAAGLFLGAYMLDKGAAGREDRAVAAVLYEASAAHGNAAAQRALAFLVGRGEARGGRVDAAESVRLTQLAASKGHVGAVFGLALAYESGRGVPRDAERAARLYKLAADEGLADAAVNLGWLYETGRGVHRDAREAAKLYALAAAEGDATAQTNLALLLLRGKLPVPAEIATRQAVELLKMAVEQGFPRAQEVLGQCYAEGSHVPQDVRAASKLWSQCRAHTFIKFCTVHGPSEIIC
eukprot:m51a1_g4057 hypothetical protein (379) ;mRNA; r:713140-714276